MTRRTFFGYLSGLLSGLLGLFGLRRATAALPEPKPQPEPTLSRRSGAPGIYEAGTLPWKPEVIEEQDIWAMFEHIVEHVALTGEAVFVADEPMARKLGFSCDTKSWLISLVKVKQSLVDAPPPRGYISEQLKVELVRKYMTSQEGKVVLCAALTGAGRNRRDIRS